MVVLKYEFNSLFRILVSLNSSITKYLKNCTIRNKVKKCKNEKIVPEQIKIN